MEEQLKKAFKETSPYPENLSDSIWSVIYAKQKRHTMMTRTLNLALTVFSVVFCIPVIANFFTQFGQSGFYQYSSLLFSDTGSIAVYWKEFLLSLADALPVTSLILSLGLVLIVLIFTRRTVSSFRRRTLQLAY